MTTLLTIILLGVCPDPNAMYMFNLAMTDPNAYTELSQEIKDCHYQEYLATLRPVDPNEGTRWGKWVYIDGTWVWGGAYHSLQYLIDLLPYYLQTPEEKLHATEESVRRETWVQVRTETKEYWSMRPAYDQNMDFKVDLNDVAYLSKWWMTDFMGRPWQAEKDGE